ncbi:MAG TPA: hypothetical protein VK151_05005 [Fluviicola sp.]|nr:hypothetical protein [Fluviicola sp.]
MKMKTILSVALIVSGLFLLAGCPISSEYPLGKKGDVALDSRLIGTFSNEADDPEAHKVTITKGSAANTYRVHVDERGGMYAAGSDDFTGWLTKLEGQTFLVLQEVVEDVETETYYVYHIYFTESGFETSDISLKVSGTAAITSIEAYREEVKASMGMNDFLSSTVYWTKN